MVRLMPLRIPQGFAVGYNKFYDADPEMAEDSDMLGNWTYFTEDLLQIDKMALHQGRWEIPSEDKCIIDLGWYPDSSREGQYRLVIANEEWEIYKQFSSRDRHDIRDTLEAWLMELSEQGFPK
ncbi:MAG: hypothetical protein E6230_27125 [Paenibacillus dendritiformis]|uniref:hypothetical protein n=1 Tax=Paenibacillus dendritiformis TaxID=130049 RepID=UPI001B1B725D|nr:hypothetical protein [Paenibacillus dendritiformis]MDU5145844.1 hypothetical protein [Paenibacillus dendritiformis]GIO71208.1 hypothetical protein J27TS7_07220 [Paenibacillus dendritiformis]